MVIKIKLKMDELLYIPSEWYYRFHNSGNSVLLHLQCDTYFTIYIMNIEIN